MERKIMLLDDREAINLLGTIAEAYMGQGNYVTEMSPELVGALRETFQVDAPAGPVSEGELAREALLVLAQDPEMAARISALIDQSTEKFIGGGVGIAVTLAVLVILQTQVEFQRHRDGSWEIKVVKKAAGDSTIGQVVKKLLGFFR